MARGKNGVRKPAPINENQDLLRDGDAHGVAREAGGTAERAPTPSPISISLTNAIAYTQNFNTLPSSGSGHTASSLPADWAFHEVGTGSNTSFNTGTGSSATGDTYSFGSTASSDRAFGTLLSGNNTPTIGASFTNNTGAAITSLLISYIGEQWRLGVASRTMGPDRLDFQISFDATSLITGYMEQH